MGQDALLDLSFAYVPLTPKAPSLAPGPPPFGLEWRRQHLGKGHLLLAVTPGLNGQVPAAREGQWHLLLGMTMSPGGHGPEMGPSGCLQFGPPRRVPIWLLFTCHTCKGRSPWSLLY